MTQRFWLFLLTLSFIVLGCDRSTPTTQLGQVQSAVSGGTLTTVLDGSMYGYSSYGVPVTFTAHVSVASESQPTITGNVIFTVDGQTTTVAVGSGNNALLVLSDLTVTTEQTPHQIYAQYMGGSVPASVSPSSSINHYVNQSSTSVTFAYHYFYGDDGDDDDERVYGEAETFTVFVERYTPTLPSGVTPFMGGSNGIAPQGTVDIYVDGSETPCVSGVSLTDDGSGVTSTGTFSLANGFIGTCPIDVVEDGHDIEGVFNPSNPGFAGDNSSQDEDGFTLNIDPADATVSFNGSTTTDVDTTQNITLSATLSPVDPSATTPTGQVNFVVYATSDSEDALFNTTVNATGGVATANWTTPGLGIGTYDAYAYYQGDSDSNDWNSSKTPAHTVITVRATTFSVALTTDATPANPGPGYTSTYGLPVTLTATLTSQSATPPTGNVVFTDGSTTLATVAFDGTTSTVTTPAFRLAGGSHSLTATYGGDANHQNSPNPGGSDTETLNIAAHGTATTMSTSPAPSKFGEVVTLSSHTGFTASGASDQPPTNPSGSVSFVSGERTLCTASVSTTAGPTLGNASCTYQLLPLGTNPITVTFTSDTSANFSNSSNNTGSQTVQQASTTVALSSSVPTTVVGSSVTLSAVVSSPGADNRGGNYAFNGETVSKQASLLSGSVQFFDGAAPIGTAMTGTPSGGSLVYTFATTSLAVGSHSITAVYSGNTNFLQSPASNTVVVVVNQDGISATVTSSANPTTFGTNITFTSTLTATTGGAPTGTLTFFDGTTQIGTGTLTSTSATASTGSASIATLGVGTHTINVSYSGDANHTAGPVATMVETINQAATTATLVAAGGTLYGQPITLTATIASTVSGDLTGVVTFSDGSTTLGTALTSAAGVATFTPTTALTVGTHNLKASYAGNTSFGPSAAATSATVAKASTTTTLSSASNPSLLSTTVNIVATVAPVAPATGVPTGVVSFTIDGVNVGTAAIDANGLATFAATNLTEGAHNVTATYGGDTHFTGSTAASYAQNVSASAATIAVSAAPSAPTWGALVTITATLTGTAAAGSPTGSVDFSSGGVSLGSGVVEANGTATTTTTLLPVGDATITAHYSGDSKYASVTGNLPITIAKAPTTTTIASSANPASAGEPVTITATVGANGVSGATGQVQFFLGTTSLGTVALSNGTAAFTASTLTTGTAALTATYLGDDHFATSTSAPLSETVNANDGGTTGGGTGASGGPGVSGNPGVSTDGGTGLNINAGNGGGSDNSCTVTNPGSPATGFSGLLGLAVAALFFVRRRRQQ